MSLGVQDAGFRIAAAVDIDATSLLAHESNFPSSESLGVDIALLSGASLLRRAGVRPGELDLLVGGPPCQGFSVGGRMNKGDERNDMVRHFARLVGETRPKYFVMENVYGLLEERYAELLDAFRRTVGRAGYSVVSPVRVLNASDYGVPQRRKRLFLLGYMDHLAVPRYPDKRSPVTVWEAIGDLALAERNLNKIDGDAYRGPLGKASEYAQLFRRNIPAVTGFRRTHHTPETLARFAAVPPGYRDPVSRFYRLTKEGVSSTLRAGTGFERGRFMAPRPIHPVYARCINLREAARLQSYPDDFQFHPIKWHAFRHVGNSVPPLLARAVAAEIRMLLGC